MYGIRAMRPHSPHVVRTMWPWTLTWQLTPGISGTRHPLQYGRARGMGAFVLPLILLDRSTYLLARDVLPERASACARPIRMDMRSVPISTTAFCEIRLLPMVLCER